MPTSDLPALLANAIAARGPQLDDAHEGALRLFGGHLEGDPRFVVDLYATTAVVFHHGEAPAAPAELGAIVEQLRSELPWIDAVVVKERQGATDDARRGRVAYARTGGAGPARAVREHGVAYAVDPRTNQDAGFYLDTRLLRRWLLDHAAGRSVLNTFAYTGSLGVAARAGGAARVVQTDLNPRFLEAAKASYALNGLALERSELVPADFFSFVRGRRLQGARFDIAILDPPFFSETRGGTIDLNRGVGRLVDKLRPLVRSGGTLVVVDNALFVSGADFVRELEGMCAGGWMALQGFVDVPDDVAGYPATRRGAPVTDPAPFRHSTKIALLSVHHA